MNTPVKRRPRTYNFKPDWEETYCFVDLEGKCVCLLCGRNIAISKKHNVARHYYTNHRTFEDNYPLKSEIRRIKVHELKLKMTAERCVVSELVAPSTNATAASSNIANVLAKNAPVLNDGELLKEAFLAGADSLFEGFHNKREILSAIRELQLPDNAGMTGIPVNYDDMQAQVKCYLDTCVPQITHTNFPQIDEENVVENTRSSSPVSRTASPTSSGMTGPYLLKKETHCSSILDELLKDDTFTDVTLSAEGQHIRAHRIILCLSSKYFKEVLSKESSAKNVIFFRDIKYDELKNLITFIYTGEVTVDAADLESFMKTAELLEVTSLCEGHKNFPKGFPLSKNSTGVSKPTTSSSKRTNSSLATHSPPSKTRKITSTTETPVQCKPRRKRSNAFSTPSTPVTVKSEPVTADSEDEDDLKEETVETSSTFIDVGHLSSEDEIGLASAARLAQGLTPEKLESTADATQVTNVTVTPGRCPFCSPTRQLYIGPIMLTHLQISHPDETAYPCDNCYSVFINKISFLAHHKECKR